MHYSASMLSFCSGAKPTYLSKCIPEVLWQKQHSEKKNSNIVLAKWQYLIRDHSWQCAQQKEHKNMRAKKEWWQVVQWNNMSPCWKHKSERGQCTRDMQPCPHTLLSRPPGEHTSSHTHPPATPNFLPPFQ